MGSRTFIPGDAGDFFSCSTLVRPELVEGHCLTCQWGRVGRARVYPCTGSLLLNIYNKRFQWWVRLLGCVPFLQVWLNSCAFPKLNQAFCWQTPPVLCIELCNRSWGCRDGQMSRRHPTPQEAMLGEAKEWATSWPPSHGSLEESSLTEAYLSPCPCSSLWCHYAISCSVKFCRNASRGDFPPVNSLAALEIRSQSFHSSSGKWCSCCRFCQGTVPVSSTIVQQHGGLRSFLGVIRLP